MREGKSSVSSVIETPLNLADPESYRGMVNEKETYLLVSQANPKENGLYRADSNKKLKRLE